MKKKNQPKEKITAFAKKLKACGHPLRLNLLVAIEKGDHTCVKELWKCLKKSQPVISQHLAVLKDLGIVKSKIEKNKRFYSIVDPFIKNIINIVSANTKIKFHIHKENTA